MRHPESAEISGYLEGDITPARAAEVEAHLETCAKCAELLSDLRVVRHQAGSLPDRMPPRDLWPEIAQAIQGGASRDPDVIRLYPAGVQPPVSSRLGSRISVPQAMAAGLILALFSGLLGARIGGSVAPDPVESPAQDLAWVQLVGSANPALEGSAREVARLEEILARHRDQLDPETARILEKNLDTIDRAITESVAALSKDPQNLFLSDHLERAIQAKGEYLREIASLVAPVG